MPFTSKSGHPNRIIVGCLVTAALSFLAGYLGWTFIGHDETAAGVPFICCLFAGSLVIAWLDVYGWRDSYGYRGLFDTRSWRWLDQRRSSRLMKSAYDDRDDQ